MSDSEREHEEEAYDLRDPNVVTKYRTAGDIANEALKFVIGELKDGAKVVDVCNAGDAYIKDRTTKIYKKEKKMEKGLGFPTCISVNHVVGHFSPLDKDTITLKTGDLVKVDLGVHIDGYIAVAAHSVVIGSDKIEGRKAEVMKCAYSAAEAALRLLKPGNTNSMITDAIGKIAADFKCNAVQGVLSHELSRYIIDGEKVILSREEVDQKVEEIEFEPNEVYAIDIVMSTGEGKPKAVDERTTVYKRALDQTYRLKMKASRAVLSQIDEEYPTFPFTIRALDQKIVKFGIVECYNHDLVHAYPIMHEKEGEIVAHIKFTALLLPNGTVRITGLPTDPANFVTDKKVTDEALVKLLATNPNKKKKKKNKKKKKKAAAPATE